VPPYQEVYDEENPMTDEELKELVASLAIG